MLIVGAVFGDTHETLQVPTEDLGDVSVGHRGHSVSRHGIQHKEIVSFVAAWPPVLSTLQTALQTVT